jgi:hypothetical protein
MDTKELVEMGARSRHGFRFAQRAADSFSKSHQI